jgi:parvulin-like peptidyl-prolyl isomerase
LTSSKFLISFLTIATCAVAVAQGAPTPAKPVAPNAGATQAPAPNAPSAPAESNVPADAPVITINGVCDVSPNGQAKPAPRPATQAKAAGSAPSAAHTDCKTQITRAEFEKLLKTVASGAPPSARRQVAARYVQFLTAANEGVKLGVDKDPDFSEQLALMRLQLLAQDAERRLQTEASNVSDADIKAYYDQNPSAFEEVTLTRIFVPRSSGDPASAQPAADSKAIADNARQQLAGGGDPEKIQKAVFEQLKNTTEPPSTKFGAKRRGTLPPAHEQKIFSLKQGEVSDVVQDSIGYVVYRVDAKQQVPFEQAKEQVKQRITQQRIEDARQKIMGGSKADYNDAYFGSEAAGPRPGQPPAPTLRPKAEMTPNSPPAAGTSASPTQSANPKK